MSANLCVCGCQPHKAGCPADPDQAARILAAMADEDRPGYAVMKKTFVGRARQTKVRSLAHLWDFTTYERLCAAFGLIPPRTWRRREPEAGEEPPKSASRSAAGGRSLTYREAYEAIEAERNRTIGFDACRVREERTGYVLRHDDAGALILINTRQYYEVR